MITVRLANAVTPRRLTGVPKVRRKAIPSIKKMSPCKLTSFPAGLVTVMILSDGVEELVVFPLSIPSGVP